MNSRYYLEVGFGGESCCDYELIKTQTPMSFKKMEEDRFIEITFEDFKQLLERNQDSYDFYELDEDEDKAIEEITELINAVDEFSIKSNGEDDFGLSGYVESLTIEKYYDLMEKLKKED